MPKMARITPSWRLLISAITIWTCLLLCTATSSGNEGRTMSARCEQQVRGDKMDHCQQYLSSEMEVIMLPAGSGNQACCLRECCDMLKQMDGECVCEAVQSLLQEMRERLTLGDERESAAGRMVMRKAMELPIKCGVPTRGCQIKLDKPLLDTIFQIDTN